MLITNSRQTNPLKILEEKDSSAYGSDTDTNDSKYKESNIKENYDASGS